MEFTWSLKSDLLIFNIFQEACREMEEKYPTVEERLEKCKTENEKLKNDKQNLLSR